MDLRAFARQHRTLLIGGAVLLLLGTIYRFSPAVGGIFPRQEDLALKLKQLAKYQQRLEDRDSLQARQVALSRQLGQAEGLLLKADTPALAAVDIQNVVNEIIYANNLEGAAIRVLKDVDAPVKGYLAIPVQVTVKLTVGQLIDLLFRIESADRLLAVTAMSLRRQAAAPAADGPEILTAVLIVEGYMGKS